MSYAKRRKTSFRANVTLGQSSRPNVTLGQNERRNRGRA